MNRQDFELCKEVVEWLMKNENLNFPQAMCIVSYAIRSDQTICESYMYCYDSLMGKKTEDDR